MRTNPSLTVAEGDDGRILLRCHAGCETGAILAELGLELRDLFPDQPGENGSRRIVAHYPYVDEDGDLLFEAVRFKPKGFAQRRPDGKAGWAWNLRGVRRVLYRLPAVAAATATVYVVEGEKDVHALEELGLVATTNPMGAGKWRDEYAEQLRGAGRVVVLPDDDEEGRTHAEQVARSVAAVVPDVRVVDLWNGGGTKKDVSDWLAKATTDEERAEARSVLAEIAKRTARWQPPGPGGDDEPPPQLRVVPLGDFATVDEASAEPLLGDGHDTVLSAGGAFVFYGAGGAGKTTLEVDLVFHLAAGIPWLGLPIPRPCRVLVIENEGPRGKFRVKLREKRAAWAGPPIDDRILVLEEPWALFTFAQETHRDALRDLIEKHEIDVVAAGPVQRLGMQGGGTPDEVGAFMLNIELARGRLERPVALLLNHHENKAGAVVGAWEGVPDTLAHAQPQGNGATRLFWQKVRWGSTIHGKAWKLLWRDGEGFEVDDTPELTDDDIGEAMLTAARENPGASWNKVETHVKDNAERKRQVRDLLLESGALVNRGHGQTSPCTRRATPFFPNWFPTRNRLGRTLRSTRIPWSKVLPVLRFPPIRRTGYRDALPQNPTSDETASAIRAAVGARTRLPGGGDGARPPARLAAVPHLGLAQVGTRLPRPRHGPRPGRVRRAQEPSRPAAEGSGRMAVRPPSRRRRGVSMVAGVGLLL
jgi:hypothetical protein